MFDETLRALDYWIGHFGYMKAFGCGCENIRGGLSTGWTDLSAIGRETLWLGQ